MYEIEEIREMVSRVPGETLTLKEVARILRVSYITVFRMVRCGEIPATRIRRVWRVPKIGLIKYLEERHPFNIEED